MSEAVVVKSEFATDGNWFVRWIRVQRLRVRIPSVSQICVCDGEFGIPAPLGWIGVSP